MDALFKLRPCSGSTVCHYLTFFHRASFSVLARRGMLPEPVRHLYMYDSRMKTRLLRLQKTRLLHNVPRATVNVIDPSSLLEKDLHRLRTAVADELASENDEVVRIANYYFNQSGKLIRPTVILLMSHLCSGASMTITDSQRKIALVAEMIHTASLLHDDVVDEATLRRNAPAANVVFGNKKTILAGDYILARATKILASIGEPFVISLLAQVIEDLVKGEFMQMSVQLCDHSSPIEAYLRKTYLKTASLFANSCKAVAYLAHASERIQALAFEYGKHAGLAFQLIDDALDFVGDTLEMGKEVAADLKLGISTAPVLFAAQSNQDLWPAMQRRFSKPGDAQFAMNCVKHSNGVEKTRELAQAHVDIALRALETFQPATAHRDCLVDVTHTILDRNR